MNPYSKTRKKKAIRSVIKNKKIIRIDHHTFIEVSADIPDDEAIRNFLERRMQSQAMVPGFRKGWNKPLQTKQEDTEISQEEMQAIIDDEIVPETD